MLTLYIINSL